VAVLAVVAVLLSLLFVVVHVAMDQLVVVVPHTFVASFEIVALAGLASMLVAFAPHTHPSRDAVMPAHTMMERSTEVAIDGIAAVLVVAYHEILFVVDPCLIWIRNPQNLSCCILFGSSVIIVISHSFHNMACTRARVHLMGLVMKLTSL
jgi:hypothetical protein